MLPSLLIVYGFYVGVHNEYIIKHIYADTQYGVFSAVSQKLPRVDHRVLANSFFGIANLVF